MSLTDFCNRPTARAPEQPLESCAGERLATPATPVEARLTTRLQLQPSFRRSPRESHGDERHTGSDASLRRCCRPLATLEARPLTPLSPSERARRVNANRAVLSSKTTSLSARGAFHRQVLPSPAFAAQGTRHRTRGLAAAEPASGTSPSTAFTRKGEAPPVDFCNHCGSPAQLRSDRPPRGAQRVAPLRNDAGGPAPHDAAPAERARARGRRGHRPRQRLLRDGSRRSFTPNPSSSGTSRHGLAPAPIESSTQEQELCPANPPSDGAQDALRARAATILPAAKRGRSRAPEVPSIDGRHKPTWYSTGCSQPVDFQV
jgi:hypothetical protein